MPKGIYPHKPLSINHRNKISLALQGHPNFNKELKGCFQKGHLGYGLKQLKSGHEKITPKKSYILGVLCGDGSVENKPKERKWRIRLSCIQKEDISFIETFEKSVEDVYGLKSKRYKEKPRKSKLNGKFIKSGERISLEINSKKIVEDILRYDSKGFKTHNWSVPKEILNSNEKNIGSFLRGFVDSDGHAYFSGFSRRIYFISSNIEGLKEIKFLLEKLGLKSKIEKNGKDSYSYRIVLQGRRNLIIFSKKIGFSIKRKKERLKTMIESYKYKVGRCRDEICYNI